MKFLQQPSFLFILGVYSGTYIVANSIEAICERRKSSPLIPKFIGSSVANVCLSVAKDKAFAKMFGKGPSRPIPSSSVALFAMRDSMTILASFSLPSFVAAALQSAANMDKAGADYLSQLLTPVSMQILSTPLHLLGLDLYNRGVATQGERIAFVTKEYFGTTGARMARILPAFGIGGVVNKSIRKSGKEFLAKQFPAPAESA